MLCHSKRRTKPIRSKGVYYTLYSYVHYTCSDHFEVIANIHHPMDNQNGIHAVIYVCYMAGSAQAMLLRTLAQPTIYRTKN